MSANGEGRSERRIAVDDSPVPPLVGRHETIADAMDAAVAAFGAREAYVDGTRRITFAEWIARGRRRRRRARRARCASRATWWRSCCRRRSTTPSRTPRSSALGAVASGLNLRLGPREVTAISRVRAARARVRRRARAVDRPARRRRTGRHATSSPDAARGVGARRRRRGRSSDPVVIIWTSGTTGVPKGAWFDHDNLRGGGHDRRRDDRAVRPSPGADTLRPRRVHGQAVGAAGVGHDHRDQPDPVDRGRHGRVARRRAHHRRRWRAHPVGEAARRARSRHRRHPARCASASWRRHRRHPSSSNGSPRASGARSSCGTR